VGECTTFWAFLPLVIVYLNGSGSFGSLWELLTFLFRCGRRDVLVADRRTAFQWLLEVLEQSASTALIGSGNLLAWLWFCTGRNSWVWISLLILVGICDHLLIHLNFDFYVGSKVVILKYRQGYSLWLWSIRWASLFQWSVFSLHRFIGKLVFQCSRSTFFFGDRTVLGLSLFRSFLLKVKKHSPRTYVELWLDSFYSGYLALMENMPLPVCKSLYAYEFGWKIGLSRMWVLSGWDWRGMAKKKHYCEDFNGTYF